MMLFQNGFLPKIILEYKNLTIQTLTKGNFFIFIHTVSIEKNIKII